MLTLARRRRRDGLKRLLHFKGRRVRVFCPVHGERIRLVNRRRVLGRGMMMDDGLRHGRMVSGDNVRFIMTP